MDMEKLLISEEITILDALRQLDETAKKVLFITKENKLMAALTDGDVRRWILSKGDLKAPVCNAANYNPKFIWEDNEENAFAYMKEVNIEALPVLNQDREIVKILFEKDANRRSHTNEMQDVPVVIMAGGLGTRLYPYTKILPKPLIPVGDVPIIEHIMNEFNYYGCKDFHLIVNHKKNMIKAYFYESDLPYTVSYADEDIPLGTGGGLSLLKGKIDSTFVLTNCDILIRENIAKIYQMHKEQGYTITMVCSVKNFTIPYGIVEIDANGEIEEMREKPSLSFLTNAGCYIVEPEVIEGLKENEMIHFPDIIEKYKNMGKKIGVYPISEHAWLDMGQMEELRRMERILMGEK